MADPDADAKAAPIEITGFGTFAIAADKSAPLLVVFGGIDVGGVHSGVYMWNYMNPLKDRYHIFVSTTNAVNGTYAYESLNKTLEAKGLTPSRRILYLFSGGYRPGMDVLGGGGSSQFSSIYLVDIWMGVTEKAGALVPNFYKSFVDANVAKTTYVYTSFGANNEKTRDYIAKKLGNAATLVKGGGMATHMSTNTEATRNL